MIELVMPEDFCEFSVIFLTFCDGFYAVLGRRIVTVTHCW